MTLRWVLSRLGALALIVAVQLTVIWALFNLRLNPLEWVGAILIFFVVATPTVGLAMVLLGEPA